MRRRTALSQKASAATQKGEAPSPYGHTSLETRVSLLVHRINSQFTQIANQLLQPHDITMYDARIMLFLLERKEMRVGEIVEATALPQSTVSHQLMRLRDRKLIRRRRSRKDNRSVAILLSPEGERIARQSEAFSNYTQYRLAQHFTSQEMRQLNSMLAKVFEVLTTSEFKPDDAINHQD